MYGKFKGNDIPSILRLCQTKKKYECRDLECRKSSTTTRIHQLNVRNYCTTRIHQLNVRNYCTEHIYKLYPNSWLYWTYPTLILCLQTKKISPDLMRWFIETYFPKSELLYFARQDQENPNPIKASNKFLK